MKLYINDLSPFAARVKLAVVAKNLPVELAIPEGGTRTPEYLAINPIGKVPTLVLDDGGALPESEPILEYLADKFPEAELRAATPELRARARLLTRICDLYVIGVGAKLFPHMNPDTRDDAAVDAGFTELSSGIGHLNTFMGDDAFAAGPTFTTADCVLPPVLLFTDLFAQLFKRPAPTSDHPKVAAYWAKIQAEPAVASVLDTMRAALKKAMGL